MQCYRYCSVLTIAGSDSGGGAGIQADLKTFAALGCFGTSAVTAITVQNTLGITAIHVVPPAIVQSQITAVMDDINPAAVKIGMLPDAETVSIVAETLSKYKGIPIIVDPVVKGTSGADLANKESVQAMKLQLFPIATLITPNLDEAALLTGNKIDSLDSMQTVAEQLLSFGSKAVLVKGGHLTGPVLYNVYANQNGETRTFSYPYIVSPNTHGTGCTLASAIAAHIARGESLQYAIAAAGNYVSTAIKKGRNVNTGKGCGPLNHFFKPRKLARMGWLRNRNRSQ